jgi:hypothetical protein
MELNSSIYKCKVYHHRLEPKNHQFTYRLYTFALDLDEIELLEKKLFFFSYEKFNLFSFYREDHLNFGKSSQKENIIFYLKSVGFNEEIDKIILVTHLRVLDYTFNPVCFYYCYDRVGDICCVLVEVHNTFGELKPYLLTRDNLNSENFFVRRVPKYFYVSPFQDLLTQFEFRIQPLGQKLQIDIDDFKENRYVFLASYVGEKQNLSNFSLLYYFFRYPLVTLHIVTQIHWQAFKLYLKKVPYFKKNQNQNLQKGVYLGKDYT